MRTLKTREAILCNSEDEIDKILKELKSQGLKPNSFMFPANAFIDFCIGNNNGEIDCASIKWFQCKKYKIFNYSEFIRMNKWTPTVGKKIWFLSGCNLEVLCEPLIEEHNNKIDLRWSFKTRKLARIARANLLKCINEQEHE